VTGYMKAKLRAERAVQASGLPHVIFRASFIVGPGGFVEEYGQLIRRAPVIPIPGNGRYPVQPVAVRDVAVAFRRALEVPARGQIYDLAGPDRVSFAEFIGAIAQAMGVRKPMVRVPMALMRPVAAVLQRLTPNPPATLDELTMLAAGNVGDPRPAAEELGLTLTPLAAAVREAVDQLRAAGRLGG
ncbi:MAG: complex I NDUFA9 subunit family protein, partial [Bacillota bacterium]